MSANCVGTLELKHTVNFSASSDHSQNLKVKNYFFQGYRVRKKKGEGKKEKTERIINIIT